MFFPINFPRTAVRLRGDDIKKGGDMKRGDMKRGDMKRGDMKRGDMKKRGMTQQRVMLHN